jgi:hypothetical protein
MLIKSVSFMTFVSLLSTSAYATNPDCKNILEGLQTKSALIGLVDQSKDHHVYSFVKDLPILAYRIASAKFSDIPVSIGSVLGAVDSTKYTEEYLSQNIGSVIALQMNGDKPDFYVIGKSV